ncbi:MAG: hypothetical protein JNL49_08470 [Bacteroidia bacterium]|nr:hypothetical protein [Bacteroidia bacterium]
MKTQKLLSITSILLAVLFNHYSANATIRRVNNSSNFNGSTLWGDNFGGTFANPVYKTLQEGVNASVNFDTLYLEGCASSQNYNGVTLTKPLTIIGEGYFLNQNENVSVSKLETQLYDITFNNGSQQSQLLGVTITGTNGIKINTSSITIRRCKTSGGGILMSNSITDINIIQCYLSGALLSGAAIGYSVGFGIVGLYINNNIFKAPLKLANINVAECRNNVFDYVQLTGSSIEMNSNNFKNNIIKDASITLNINNGLPSSSVSFNTGSSNAQFDYSGGYNNQLVPNMTTLFVANGSTDGLYQLQSGVINNYAGDDSTDRGAFGGSSVTNRYTLSGLASIPVIYDIFTSGTATQQSGLDVTIKARTIK